MDSRDKYYNLHLATQKLLQEQISEYEFIRTATMTGVPVIVALTVPVSTILNSNHHKYN